MAEAASGGAEAAAAEPARLRQQQRLQDFTADAGESAPLLCAFIERIAEAAAAEGASRGAARGRRAESAKVATQRRAHVGFAVAHALHAWDPRFQLEFGHKLAVLIKTMSLSAARSRALEKCFGGRLGMREASHPLKLPCMIPLHAYMHSVTAPLVLAAAAACGGRPRHTAAVHCGTQ